MELVQLSENSSLHIAFDAVECTDEEFNELATDVKYNPKYVGDPDLVGTGEKGKRVMIKMFNKAHPTPRDQKLYGPPGLSYKFTHSYALLADQKQFSLVEKCMKYAQDKYPELKWNAALVNVYRDKDDSISPHSDDETGLIENAPILSFSFGCERKFVVKPKAGGKSYTTMTKHGSCISMCGKMQKEFVHEIPKSKDECKPRINITIRSFDGTSGKYRYL